MKNSANESKNITKRKQYEGSRTCFIHETTELPKLQYNLIQYRLRKFKIPPTHPADMLQPCSGHKPTEARRNMIQKIKSASPSVTCSGHKPTEARWKMIQKIKSASPSGMEVRKIFSVAKISNSCFAFSHYHNRFIYWLYFYELKKILKNFYFLIQTWTEIKLH